MNDGSVPANDGMDDGAGSKPESKADDQKEPDIGEEEAPKDGNSP